MMTAAKANEGGRCGEGEDMSQNESIADPSSSRARLRGARGAEQSRAQREAPVRERVVAVAVAVVVVVDQPASNFAMLTHTHTHTRTHRLDRAERGGIRGQCNADIESVRQGCRLRNCGSESSRSSGTDGRW